MMRMMLVLLRIKKISLHSEEVNLTYIASEVTMIEMIYMSVSFF